MPLTHSSSRVMRRTMARLVTVRLPCAACQGTGSVPDPPRARVEPPEPKPGPQSSALDGDRFAALGELGDADAALFRKVLGLIDEAKRSGEFSGPQAEANLSAVQKLVNAAALPVAGVAEARTQAARMDAVIAEHKTAFVRPSAEQTRRDKIPDRAATLLRLLSPLKSYLVDQANGPGHGRVERERGRVLLAELARAMKALQDAPGHGEVRRIEHFQLRSLAWSIRRYGLRRHVMVAEPFWGAAPLAADAACVFFAGGAAMRTDVHRFCEKRGLTLLHAPDGGGTGQLRWDQIRESVVGVFDLTMRSSRDRASVCHALGLALATGRYPLVLANHGQRLPFDIDVDVQGLAAAQRSSGIVARWIDDALFSLHRVTGASSVAATAERIEPASKPVDGVHLEETIGRAIERPRLLLHPAWPAAYPDPGQRTCFHVMPFGKPWSNGVRDKVRRAVEGCGFEYRRGDQGRDVQIIRSIWDEICRASAVVVDLTGLNQNVSLELGLAQAVGRPVLLMTQDEPGRTLFPEVAKLRITRYSPAGRDVRQAVQGWCSTLADG